MVVTDSQGKKLSMKKRFTNFIGKLPSEKQKKKKEALANASHFEERSTSQNGGQSLPQISQALVVAPAVREQLPAARIQTLPPTEIQNLRLSVSPAQLESPTQLIGQVLTVQRGLSTESSTQKNTRTNKSTEKINVVYKKGHLRKRKGLFGSWTTSWFVLESTFLMEFKNANEESDKPRKVINLASCALKYHQDVTGYPLTFGLFFSNHTLLFQATDESQLVDWLCMLRKFCSRSQINWRTTEVLEAFRDAVIVTSNCGKILEINTAAVTLFGRPRNDVVGEPVELLIPSDSQEPKPGVLRNKGLKSLLGTTTTVKCNRSDGTTFQAVLSVGECMCANSSKLVASLRPQETLQNGLPTHSIENVVDRVLEKVLKDAKHSLRHSLHVENIPHPVEEDVAIPQLQIHEVPPPSPVIVRALFDQKQENQFHFFHWKIVTCVLLFVLVMSAEMYLPRSSSIWAFNMVIIGLGFLAVSLSLFHFVKEDYFDRKLGVSPSS